MDRIADPKHPLWTILTIVSICGVLALTCNTFDEDEIKDMGLATVIALLTRVLPTLLAALRQSGD